MICHLRKLRARVPTQEKKREKKKKIAEMLGLDGEYPADHPKGKF